MEVETQGVVVRSGVCTKPELKRHSRSLAHATVFSPVTETAPVPFLLTRERLPVEGDDRPSRRCVVPRLGDCLLKRQSRPGAALTLVRAAEALAGA